MKQLLLLRHAKSNWEDSSIEDFYRPLKKKGEKDAKIIGEYLKNINLLPQYIICSDSVRTKETLKIVLSKINFENKIKFVYAHTLYEASVDNILNEISKINNIFERVMVIGHNPGMIETVVELTKKPFPFPKFSTSGIAFLKLDINSWKDIKKSKAELEFFKSPKMFY